MKAGEAARPSTAHCRGCQRKFKQTVSGEHICEDCLFRPAVTAPARVPGKTWVELVAEAISDEATP